MTRGLPLIRLWPSDTCRIVVADPPQMREPA